MDPINVILILALIFGAIYVIFGNKAKAQNKTTEESNAEAEAKETLPIKGAYQKSWLFSYNEKDAYAKLKPIAEELGYTVFAKVRLLDLLEPVRGNPKYKTYLYKIQAKHVDFVLCDAKLVARYIIELDDSSHDTARRKERDAFVDEVVQSVGYQIIHVRAIDKSIRQQIEKL